MELRWEILAGYGPLFLHGLVMTVLLTVVSLTLGMALGLTSGLVSSAGEKRVHSPWGWLLAASVLVWAVLRTIHKTTQWFTVKGR